MKEKWVLPFLTLWTGQAVSLLGSQLVQFGLVWWLTRTTGSAAVLAGATLVALLPRILLGPFAGALVDRWNRRIVMLVTDGVIALATLVLIGLFATGQVQVWHVYAVMLIRAAGGAFHLPAMQASTSLMVPAGQLARIQGLNSTLSGSMDIISPPLGALLLEALPMQGVLSIDIITAAVGMGALLLTRVPQPERAASAESPHLGRDMKAGLDYVRRMPGLLILLIMAVAINFLLVPAGALLPLLARNHFGGDALQYGGMESAAGIGIVVGGVVLGLWGGFKRKIVTSQLGLIGIGVAHVALGLLPGTEYTAALAVLFMAGFMMPFNGTIMAILQTAVAPEMQGRVFALVGSASAIMSPLSLAVAGPLAETFGVRFWYVTAGVCCMVMGALALTIPAVLDLERGPRPQAAEAAYAGPEAVHH